MHISIRAAEDKTDTTKIEKKHIESLLKSYTLVYFKTKVQHSTN